MLFNFWKDNFALIKSLHFKYGKEAGSLRLFYLVFSFLGKKFDLIHCHYGFNGTLGVYLKELGFGNKVVTTFYGYDLSQFIAQYGNEVYKDLFLKGDLFLAISEFFKEKIIRLGCPKDKIAIHRLGTDLELFQYCPRGKDIREPAKLLTVGRLAEKKGHEYAIKAVAGLIKKGRRINYIIAGDGPLKEALSSLVSQEGISKYVAFIGPCTRDKIIGLYNEADIFILPSVTSTAGDTEGVPVVLMEAQASGCPVISTFHSGIPEVVIDGESGFLVPERDIETLSEKLEYLLVRMS